MNKSEAALSYRASGPCVLDANGQTVDADTATKLALEVKCKDGSGMVCIKQSFRWTRGGVSALVPRFPGTARKVAHIIGGRLASCALMER